MSKNINLRKLRKDKYLSELIEWMANDDKFNSIFNSNLQELLKDYQILKLLIDSGKFHLEITDDEIRGAFNEEKIKSSKSKLICEKHVSHAKYFFQQQAYSSAIHSYAKAIVKQPLRNLNDYQLLADLYLSQAQCFLQMNDEEAAAISFQFALTADRPYSLFKMTEKDQAIHKKYEASILLLCGDFGPKAKIGPMFDIISEPEQVYRLVPSTDINQDTMVCMERPLVKYCCTTFDNCARCDKYIRNFLYWPCEFCSDIVFCSVECYQKEFEYHKYECGLSRYASQIPLMILMLRFYFRTKTNPAYPLPSNVDFIKKYLDMFQQKKNNEIMDEPEPIYLNVFRQCMDFHEKRMHLHKNTRHYYACLIMAVEFTYLFNAMLFNGEIVQQQKNQLKASFNRNNNNNSKIESNELLPPSMPRAEFNWAKPLYEDIIELIAVVFLDLKRFVACPFTKFELQPKDPRENKRKERRILLLSGIFFPKQQVYFTNLIPIYHRHCGKIEIRTSKPLLKGEKLLLNKNMMIPNTGDNIDQIKH